MLRPFHAAAFEHFWFKKQSGNFSGKERGVVTVAPPGASLAREEGVMDTRPKQGAAGGRSERRQVEGVAIPPFRAQFWERQEPVSNERLKLLIVCRNVPDLFPAARVPE